MTEPQIMAELGRSFDAFETQNWIYKKDIFSKDQSMAAAHSHGFLSGIDFAQKCYREKLIETGGHAPSHATLCEQAGVAG
jgi:hypothetical protein